MIPKRYQVQSRIQESNDSYTLILNPMDEQILSFHPGQFNMLYFFGFGEIAISISGDPSQQTQMVHTIRAVGPITNAMGLMQEGDTVGLRGPFGNVWPLSKNKEDLLIIAGGLGLAPLRPVLYSLIANRNDYNKITLLYGARTPEDFIYKDEIQEWKKRGIDVILSVDKASVGWRGNVGVITSFIRKNIFDPKNTRVFLCGPEIMMKFALTEILHFPIAEHKVFLSMERNMKCAVGFCGHCLYGPHFICKDGPIFSYDQLKKWLPIQEL